MPRGRRRDHLQGGKEIVSPAPPAPDTNAGSILAQEGSVCARGEEAPGMRDVLRKHLVLLSNSRVADTRVS